MSVDLVDGFFMYGESQRSYVEARLAAHVCGPRAGSGAAVQRRRA